MGFSDCPCYWPLRRTNWAPVLGRCQGLGRLTGLTFSLGLASELACLFLNPRIIDLEVERVLWVSGSRETSGVLEYASAFEA